MAKRRKSKVIFWGVGIVIVAAAVVGVCVKYPVSGWKIFKGSAPVIPAGWQNYQNSDYGFSLYYPPDWQMNTGQLQNDVPAVLFGNPINGTSTYTLRVSVMPNRDSLSSAQYVASMLAQDEAHDAANGTNTPQSSAQFMRSTGFAVNDNDGYELNNVFEFDHDAERIYVARNDEVLVFDFPVADANPNISSPAENNVAAHQIVKTLAFIKQVAGNALGVSDRDVSVVVSTSSPTSSTTSAVLSSTSTP